MKDTANSRRGTPMISANGRQSSSWASADMHYPLGNTSFASGSGTNTESSRLQHINEESWQDRRSYGEDFGKGPECSRSTGHKSSHFSPKLAVTRASEPQTAGGTHTLLSLQGPWDSMHGLSGSMDSSGSGNMDTDINSGTGLSSSLGLSEVPILARHMYLGSSHEYSFGKSGQALGSNSDLYPVHGSTDNLGIGSGHVVEKGSGHVVEKGIGSSSTYSGLRFAGRSTGLAGGNTYHASREAVIEGTSRDSFGLAVANSFPPDEEQRDGHGSLHHVSSTSYNFLSDPYIASCSTSRDHLGEEATCSSDSHFFLRSAVVGRAHSRESHSLREKSLGNSVSTPSSSRKGALSSSRASACKRKSCTSSMLVNSSCQSRFHHSSGQREGYGMRSMGGSSSGRRSSSTTSCVSVSDVVASASAVVAGRCADTSVAAIALDEPRTRKNSAVRDGDSLGIGRTATSLSGGNLSAASGSRSAHNGSTAGQMDHLTLSKTHSPLPRAVRRPIPPLQPDPWCSQSDSLPGFSGTDFASGGASTSLRAAEPIMASGGGRRSGSPLVVTNRSGSTSSSRHNDHLIGSSYGERLSHRLTGNSSRNMTLSATGGAGSFAGIGTEARLRFRNHINGSADPMNTFGSVGAQSQTLAHSPGLSRSGSVSGSSSSRLPPQPLMRYRQNPSSLHVPVLSPPSSGLAPSRLSPSAATASSLSSPMDMLLPGSSVFQSSLLPRSSSLDGRSEEGFVSNEDSRIGFPFRGSQLSDGDHHPRHVADGLAEILQALDRVERDEDLTYEQLLMLEATLLFGGMGLHDQHSDLRLDVDSMSYEELLALEERIGNVSTGLAMDTVEKGLKWIRYSSQAAEIAGSQESDIKCTVCQEEYEEGDELGKIDCGHSYHIACIKQWLVQKNQCPICKAPALS